MFDWATKFYVEFWSPNLFIIFYNALRISNDDAFRKKKLILQIIE